MSELFLDGETLHCLYQKNRTRQYWGEEVDIDTIALGIYPESWWTQFQWAWQSHARAAAERGVGRLLFRYPTTINIGVREQVFRYFWDLEIGFSEWPDYANPDKFALDWSTL